MRFLGTLFVSVLACAQPAAEPEIHGTVQEYGSNSPLAAVEITIKEFVLVDSLVTPKVVATELTNSRGEFSFKPGHIGNFYVEGKKDGYSDVAALPLGSAATAEASIRLSATDRQVDIRLTLMRPGDIVGRVVDAAGNPISDMRMTLENPPQIAVAFRTDADGNFRLSVRPGRYTIQTASQTTGIDAAVRGKADYDASRMIAYTEQASQIVDQEYESLYWPGGASTPSATLPMQVGPAATGNFGTIVLRKIPKYRAHIFVEGECAKDESRGFTVVPATDVILTSFTTLGCSRDFLLRGLPPGDYLLAIWSRLHWAEVPLTIRDHNIESKVTMLPGLQINGRVIASEGTQLSSLGSIRIALGSMRNFLPTAIQTVQPDAQGVFAVRDVLWQQQSLAIETLNPGVYVKEIRFGGAALRGPTFDGVAGASLEVVLDNGAASIEGIVMDLGKPQPATVLLVRWPAVGPVSVATMPPFQYFRGTPGNGKFTISSLAPGEYRLIALSDATNLPDGALDRMLAGAERVTLNRGEQKKLEVKLTDSAR